MNSLRSTRLVPGVLRLLSLLLLCNLAHGTTFHFSAILTGPDEAPPNASPGIGVAEVYYNDVSQTMHVTSSFSGLIGTTTASHIHAATAVANTGTAGVATQTPSFIGFPLGVTAGSMDNIYDMTLATSFRAGYITSNGGSATTASAALLAAMLAEKTYFNIHTNVFPGGEIRGFLHLTSVPDHGSSLLLLTIGLAALAGISRRRKIGA